MSLHCEYEDDDGCEFEETSVVAFAIGCYGGFGHWWWRLCIRHFHAEKKSYMNENIDLRN